MLQVKTKEQREKIESILGVTSYWMDSDEIIEGIHIDDYISFEEMSQIVDFLRSPSDKKEDVFEKCWIAYGRKGIKQKARQYWNKLKESEMDMVMPHIKAYVSSRNIQYQKDFERYLRDKVFMEVVYQGNNIIYDPTKQSCSLVEYLPTCGGALMYNDYYKCYMYTGYWGGRVADGYTDENRPDGARLVLNNGRGTVLWSREHKEWRLSL